MKSRTATILSVTLILGCILILLGFASIEKSEQRITAIEINIIADDENRFLTPLRVREHLNNYGPLIGLVEKDLSLYEIYEHIMLIPSVESANVFPTLDGELHINLTQRKPRARVHSEIENDYYIDESGKYMHLDEQFSARVPIIHAINYESALKGVAFLDATDGDDFWGALIDQIIVNNKGELELVPRIGSRIFLGLEQDPVVQRRNLLTFYRAQIESGNLKKYSRIDLSYKDQVIAKRHVY
jgi:cell division protein FtsQ